jgi:hypothetical protein
MGPMLEIAKKDYEKYKDESEDYESDEDITVEIVHDDDDDDEQATVEGEEDKGEQDDKEDDEQTTW